MNEALRIWCERAWTAVARLPGGVGGDLRTRWDRHVARDRVVVTFFGPYDSGKSSLLKRLLVDDGQSVPDWLTVSGRRETFEPQEASALGVLVRDTPGIAGGNELHEAAAKEALLLSDAVVLVLPPQLVTSDRESILAVLSGRRFGCPPTAAYPDRGLAVVLSRMDEAGAMPRDDIAGYHALVKRKREELSELFRAEGIPESVVVVHAVAADAFGLVGNACPRNRAEYDPDRHWDGVAAFADFVGGLAPRKVELRQRAEVRYLGAEVSSIRASLAQMDAETRTASEAAANDATSYALVQERLRALLGAARADLDRRIEEEVSAAGRRGAADVKELREAVLGRLEAALERWSKEHDSALEALVREADTELKARRERPSWKKLADVLNGSQTKPKPAASGKEARQTVDKVHRVAKTLHKGFREAQPAVIGMSLEKARGELQRLQQAASFEEYAKQTRKGATRLRDAAHATQARRAVLLDVGFDVALPAILELGGLVAEAWVEHKAAQQRAEHREEVRRVIEESSKQLAERAWELWRDEGMPSALEAALADARASAESVAASLRAESGSIGAALEGITALLADLQSAARGTQG
jgi:hypothetical protein